MIDHTVGFLENWQDALVFWSFVAVTVLVTWRILVSKPRD
jgi:cyanate permease